MQEKLRAGAERYELCEQQPDQDIEGGIVPKLSKEAKQGNFTKILDRDRGRGYGPMMWIVPE